MSACLGQFLVRRMLGPTSATVVALTNGARASTRSSIPSAVPLIATSSLAFSKEATSTNTLSIRSFAAAAAETKKSNKASKSSKTSSSTDSSLNGDSSYKARKEALKLKRRETFERSQQRLARLATRRDHSPKDVKKQAFRSWWDNELKYHDQLLRMAKRNNQPWRIRVSAMVERLPIVTPDMPGWEREFVDLTDYLSTFGIEYPEETGFMYAMDKPEDHVVPTDEELLAGLPFTPAPRETEADATGFLQTRDRQLKTSAFLAIKTNAENTLSGESRWTLPSALADPHTDTTLLEVAKRAVSNVAGKELELWCPSNAPMAVNLRVYNKNMPEEFRMNYFGEKIFYYRVQHDRGDVNLEALKKAEGGGVNDWGWLTKEEIVDRVTEERGKHQAKFFHYML